MFLSMFPRFLLVGIAKMIDLNVPLVILRAHFSCFFSETILCKIDNAIVYTALDANITSIIIAAKNNKQIDLIEIAEKAMQIK